MIPREAPIHLLLLGTSLLIGAVRPQGERAHDTSDWIPITPSSRRSSASEIVERKIASDRALGLEPPGQKFFPDEQQQQYRSGPNQVPQFVSPPKKAPFDHPRPRKLKHPKYEIPPPPPSPIDHYNGGQRFVPFSDASGPNYYEISRPDKHAPVPSVNPRAPSVDAESIYENYQLPFNKSFYQSLSPAAINNDFYRAVNSNNSQTERENVQLVYVPAENLPHTNIQPEAERLVYNSSPAPPPRIDHEQARLQTIQRDFIQQALRAHKLQEQLGADVNPVRQEIASTTAAEPKKKPHQPPLAVFLGSGDKAEISDVLEVLKDARSIPVQDSVARNGPRIFVGPSNLNAPRGYTKFPLPYLNNINGSRVERKIDRLPFFVAPVSYDAPAGYAKISLPSPHVGSVVVSVPSSVASTTPGHPNEFSSRQGNIASGFDFVDLNADLYQGAPTPQADSHSAGQPELYYVQQPHTYDGPTFEPKQEPVRSTTRLPNLNPLELAINEFELNGQSGERSKVKHSTTRGPSSRYGDGQTVSSTRAQTTERAVSRGRVRGRGRGTTATATAPIGDRYTVLEELVASRPSTESAQEKPGFRGSPYLPEETFEVAQVVDEARHEVPEAVQIENVPANVYSLGQATYQNENFNRPGLTYTKLADASPEEKHVTTDPIKSERVRPLDHRFSPEVVRYENREPVRHRPSEEPDQRQYLEETVKPPSARYSEEEQEQQGDSESAFPDNLFQPNFDQTYVSLQDQAVRSLLVPNLLAPSSEDQETPSIHQYSAEAASVETSPRTEAAVTTTTKTARTRGRGRTRPATASTTAAPRRASSRRRPAANVRTTAAPPSPPPSYSAENDLRSRLNEISDRSSTTTDVNYFKEPIAESVFDAADREPAQSFIQYQPVITARPNAEEVPVTALAPVVLEYENTRGRPRPVESEYGSNRVQPPRPAELDHVVQPRPVANDDDRVPDRSGEEDNYVRHHNANIKSSGVINDRKSDTAAARTGARTRGRSRFATTTLKPVTRIPNRPPATTSATEELQSYGFTRQPGYTPSNLNVRANKFVGEIRPKYARPTTTASSSAEEAETARPRVRSGTRAPGKRPASNNKRAGAEQGAGRSGTATRTRGRAHYRAQENLKRESDDEDVAHQNYPPNFLQKLESSTKKSGVSADPPEGGGEDDQSPYSSLYVPKFVAKPNGLPNEDKPAGTLTSGVDPEAVAVSYATAEESGEVTESEINKVMEEMEKIQPEEVTTQNNSRRRGVWKLIRAGPVDPLEVSESQNYETVLNAFDAIERVDAHAKGTGEGANRTNVEEEDEVFTTVNTEGGDTEAVTEPVASAKAQGDIFDAIHEMFGAFRNATSAKVPATPEADVDSTAVKTDEEVKPSTKPYEVEPWRMRALKTSTSTEVSHETEICYKGKCVKSQDGKPIK